LHCEKALALPTLDLRRKLALPNSQLREVDPLKVQTRGTTSQFEQQSFWTAKFDHKASIAAKLRQAGNYDLADKLDDCHRHTTFKRCRGCNKVTTFNNRCDLIICPTCQPRIARKRLDSVSWWAEKFIQPKHVVLTVRNVDSLTTENVNFLKHKLSALRRSKFAVKKTTRHRGLRELINVRRKRGQPLRTADLRVTSYPWHGGLWSLEVTNESNGWHLHFHLLVESRFIDATGLAQKWAKLVGQKFAIVKVKDARRQDYLHEVIKYAAKSSTIAGWQPNDIAAFVAVFSDCRTFGVFGALYKIRASHGEWAKTLADCRDACECGSTNFQFYSQAAWDWYLETKETGPPKDPRSIQERVNATLEFSFHGN
jgi:diadenosine tetraphosphate (Ap4A) HIT family hydrolase